MEKGVGESEKNEKTVKKQKGQVERDIQRSGSSVDLVNGFGEDDAQDGQIATE